MVGELLDEGLLVITQVELELLLAALLAAFKDLLQLAEEARRLRPHLRDGLIHERPHIILGRRRPPLVITIDVAHDRRA